MEEDSPSSQLRELAEKHNLRHVNRRVDGKPLTWLERPHPPEGFEFELPKPLRLFELHPKATTHELSMTGPLNEDVWDTVLAEYKKSLERSKPSEDRKELGRYDSALLEAIEKEKARYQRAFDKRARTARNLLNAWVFFAAESHQKPALPEEGNREQEELRYNWARSDLVGQWRRGPGEHIKEKRREQQKLWVLKRLTKHFGASLVLYYEAHRFWRQLVRAQALSSNIHPTEQVRADFQALCEAFDIPDLLRESFTDGIVHYRRELVGLTDTLSLLDCKRVAHEWIQHALVFDQQPSLQEEVKLAKERRKDNKLRAIYEGAAADYWRYAYQLYRNQNELNTWKEVYDYMREEQQQLGYSKERHKNFSSFESARTSFQSQYGDPET